MKKKFTFLLILAALNSNAQPCIPNTNSVSFDGFSSQVAISPQTGLDITSTITIEAWINPSSFGFDQAQNSIVCKHGWSSGEGGYVLRCGGSGVLSFNIAGLDPNQIPVSWMEVMSSTNVLTLNTWTHVAGTFDGNEVKCYVNGTLAGSLPFIGTIVPSTSYPLAIGRLADPVWGPDRYFAGLIDEVRIWNRALSETELQSGMNNHIDPTFATGLVSYWRMNEGANATLYDVAGSNNGGLINCTWSTSVPFNAVPSPLVIYMNDSLICYADTDDVYQWYLDGNVIAGATQNIYVPLQNGTYTVEVTSPEGCTVPFITTLMDVSVNEQYQLVNYSLSPNPFSKETVLNIQSKKYTGDASLIVTDIQGRHITEISNIKVSPILNKLPIQMELANGTYFYQLKFGTQIAAKGKMIVE